jgi:hypothetical protein
VVSNFAKMCWRLERKKVTGTVIRGLLLWQAPRRSPSMQDVIHSDVVQCLSTWRTAVSGQRWRGLSRLIGEQVGAVKLIRDRARAYLVPGFLLRHDYPLAREHESRQRRRSWRKGHRRRGDQNLILAVYCTMGLFFSQPDRPCLGRIFS